MGLLALALLAGGGAAWRQHGEGGRFGPTALLVPFDRWLLAKGLGIEQIALEGHRYTPDADIFDALALDNAGSMLRFDGTQAANRMLRLPWVQRVQIKPQVPNGLHVVITERAPYAVWENEGRRHLIDKTGHRLAAIGPGSFATLPRVHGDGAANAIADLHATLSLFPAIETRLASAVRVGGRRWTLVMNNGLKVQLPAEQEAAALQSLAVLQARSAILDRDLAEVDLRVAGLTVRPRASSAGSAGVAAELPRAHSPQM